MDQIAQVRPVIPQEGAAQASPVRSKPKATAKAPVVHGSAPALRALAILALSRPKVLAVSSACAR